MIYSGDHKVDGNPYEKLPKDVREAFQSRIDATRQMFAEKVAGYTGMSVRAVLDTEAAVFSGQESIDHGLADELVNSTDAIGVMRSALDTKKTIHIGGTMKTTTTNAAATQPDANAAPETNGAIATTPAAPAAVAPAPDVNALVAAAVSAENARIMGILKL
ncbi:serine peptidase [Klebsiella oxytoca]|nr:serine peptidase [Klebsiella oxytoca]